MTIWKNRHHGIERQSARDQSFHSLTITRCPGIAHLLLQGRAHSELEQELDEPKPPAEDIGPVGLGTDRVLDEGNAPEGDDDLERRFEREPERPAPEALQTSRRRPVGRGRGRRTGHGHNSTADEKRGRVAALGFVNSSRTPSATAMKIYGRSRLRFERGRTI